MVEKTLKVLTFCFLCPFDFGEFSTTWSINNFQLFSSILNWSDDVEIVTTFQKQKRSPKDYKSECNLSLAHYDFKYEKTMRTNNWVEGKKTVIKIRKASFLKVIVKIWKKLKMTICRNFKFESYGEFSSRVVNPNNSTSDFINCAKIDGKLYVILRLFDNPLITKWETYATHKKHVSEINFIIEWFKSFHLCRTFRVYLVSRLDSHLSSFHCVFARTPNKCQKL